MKEKKILLNKPMPTDNNITVKNYDKIRKYKDLY